MPKNQTPEDAVAQSALQLTPDEYRKAQKNLKARGKRFRSFTDTDNHQYVYFADDETGLPAPLGLGQLANCIGFLFPVEGEEAHELQERQETKQASAREASKEDRVELRVFDQSTLSHILHFLAMEETGFQEYAEFQAERNEALEYSESAFAPYGMRVIDPGRYPSLLPPPPPSNISDEPTQKFPLVDFVITDADAGDLKLLMTNLQGWKAPSKKDDQPTATTPYGNIAGFVFVDENMSLSDRKALTLSAQRELVRYYPNPALQVLTIDRHLIAQWKDQGTPFADPEEVQRFLETSSTKKKIDYGFLEILTQQPNPPKVSVRFHEPGGKSHIGGTRISVEVRWDENTAHIVMLDFGLVFNHTPAWNGMGKQPSYEEGIYPHLREEQLFPSPRLYRTDLIAQSLRPERIRELLNPPALRAWEQQIGPNSPKLHEFIALELFHRHGGEGLEQHMREKFPEYLKIMKASGEYDKVMRLLQEREKEVYAKKPYYAGLAITHAHQDHTIGSSFVRDVVTRFWSPITRGFLLADHKLSSTWYIQDTAARKMREMPKVGASYPVLEYPYRLLEHGKRIEVAPGVYLTPFDVYHSIPGAMGFVLDVYHKGVLVNSIAYGGDYRNGDFFHEVGQMHDGTGADLVLAEGTNPPGAKKSSLYHTEKTVKQRFDISINQADQDGALVIVDLVKNAFERLQNIIEVAQSKGRTVAISPGIAYRYRAMALQLSTVGGVSGIPNLLDKNILIWKAPMARYTPEERAMFEMYTSVDQDVVSSYPEKYTLIREGSKSPEKLEGIGADCVYWIQSVYDAYDEVARIDKRYRKKFADEKGWNYLTQGFHATGHGPLLLPNHPQAAEGILGQLHHAYGVHGLRNREFPSHLAFIHTQKRGMLSKLVREYEELQALTFIHDKFFHPYHSIHLQPRAA